VNNGPSIIDSEHRNSTNGYTNDQTHTYKTLVKYLAGVPTLDILMEEIRVSHLYMNSEKKRQLRRVEDMRARNQEDLLAFSARLA